MTNEYMELVNAFSVMLDERDARWDKNLEQKLDERDARWDKNLEQKLDERDAKWDQKMDQRFAAHQVKWKEDLNQILDTRFHESENMVLKEIDRVHESLIEHKKDTKSNFEQMNRRMDRMQQKMDANHNEILQAYSFLRNHGERIERLEQKVS
ncbi:MAG: hypothetical protein PHQ72_01400 [Hespellia sp.]|nr:hypothetical protein [Hespellia sp.]